jgi:hypothetical protein
MKIKMKVRSLHFDCPAMQNSAGGGCWRQLRDLASHVQLRVHSATTIVASGGPEQLEGRKEDAEHDLL